MFLKVKKLLKKDLTVLVQVWRKVWRCRGSSCSRTPSWFGNLNR